MGMKVLLAGLILFAILTGLIAHVWYFSPQNVIFCTPGDLECLRRAARAREHCNPSHIYVETENRTLEVNLDPGPEGCTICEKIENTNYSVNCTVPIGETECPEGGSLYDYVAPEGGGGGPEEEELPPEQGERPVLECSLTDVECKNRGAYYLENCISSTITDDDKRWASGYWTKYIAVDRTGSTCKLYFEITNAVDIPPEIPPDIVGMTMDCEIPLSEFPITEVEEGWCTGELYKYLVE